MAYAAAALRVVFTKVTRRETLSALCLRIVRQAQRGQRDARETDAEFLQRAAARDGLGQAFGEFIEFVVHNSPFLIIFVVLVVEE
jgi:hypothetical protein